jgi:alkylhydroperoxidase family enzyme
LEDLSRKFGDRVEFLAIYVREAHPIDGWRMESNDRVGVAVLQPKAKFERAKVATQCHDLLETEMPLLVDGIDDRVGHAYSGMPDRLYVVDRAGKVAFKSGRGPFWFNPGEMEQSLIMNLLDETRPAEKAQARVPLLDNDLAWQRLPVDHGASAPDLPNWARALASSLPRTTAAMLDLDYKHRTKSPLSPLLRAKLRWVAADANRSDYGRAYAEADLRRAGVDEIGLKTLAEDQRSQPEPERLALAFARKMTLSADTVTDEEVSRLMTLYGERKLAAMVLLLAYANFQDRLLLSLGVPVEAEGPLAPLAVRLDPKAPAVDVPARVRPPGGLPPAAPERVDDPNWGKVDFDQLRTELGRQQARSSRIRVPSWDEVRPGLPAGYPAPDHPVRIQWSLVCLGYQPELAAAWSACTRSFGEEAKQDRVFEESLFWVVTRTIHCFY